METIRNLFAGQTRTAATTAAVVIVFIQVFLPTIFDMLTGLVTIGLVWFLSGRVTRG